MFVDLLDLDLGRNIEHGGAEFFHLCLKAAEPIFKLSSFLRRFK